MRPYALLVAALVAAVSACGGDEGVTLSAAGEAGRSVFRSNGCASCHGANGQGGPGPRLEGLWGTDVDLDDGTTVTADEAYLTESIRDPEAKIVDGYQLQMPTKSLDDDEIASILDWLEEIGPSAAGGPALSAAALDGREVYRDDGCGTCHGDNGEGGTGTVLVGRWGSEVELQDGTTVVADEAYMRRAITDPDADLVAGYGLRMPASTLGDDEIDQVLTYLRAIGSDAETTP
jgi:cytochrome c oxidase subunit 2